MKIIITFFLLLFVNQTQCQITLSGIVKSDSNEPLEYVNIGIKYKNIGTISDEKGNFKIIVNDIELNELLTFSYIGFEEKQIRISELQKTNFNEIILNESQIILSEVTIISTKPKRVELGTKSYVSMVAGYLWNRENFENRDITEHAKYLNIKKPSRILNLHMNLFNVFEDSITFRINFYTIKDELPNERINNMVLTENIKEGWNVFDLKDYDLKFDQPVFITFEYIPKSKTDKEPCRISGQFFGKTITRNASLGNWNVSSGKSMAMYVEIEQ